MAVPGGAMGAEDFEHKTARIVDLREGIWLRTGRGVVLRISDLASPGAAKKDDSSPIVLCTFLRSQGPAGTPVTLKVVANPACDGRTLSVSLLRDGMAIAQPAGQVRIVDGQGLLDLEIPGDAAPGAVIAKVSGDGLEAETSAPYYVLQAARPPGTLKILSADGAPGHAPGKLRIGAGVPLRLEWAVEDAAKATLKARPLAGAGGDAPAIDLPVGAGGSGSGAVPIEQGLCASTEYVLSIAPRSGAATAEVKATAFVANLNVQVELPDGSDYARSKPCRLEIPGQPPIESATNPEGELWLWLPNAAVEDATLKLLDAGRELASWKVALHADAGVPAGAPALNDGGP